MSPALDQLDALAARRGYARVDPPVLQPAGLFLDLLGEDMRRQAFLTQDADGQEFCLRPDFTVPVSRLHLAEADGQARAYAYRGPVFRLGGPGSGEVLQAGFESFGRTDREAADAELLGMALEACAILGVEAPVIRMGDAGLVSALLDALRLPPAWRRRLAADVQRSRNLDADLARLAAAPSGAAARAGFLAALEGADPGAARAAVADLLSIAGIRPVGGRAVDEIADRFLEQASLAAGGGMPAETVALAQKFFAVAGDPDTASAAMRALAADAGLDLAQALDAFDLRTGFIAAYGTDLSGVQFATAFTRNLDYYTGFVFTLDDGGTELVGGGRYDRLMTDLRAPEPIPAVGCAIWLERFGGEPS